MLTEYVVKRGFGPGRIKEYFVAQRDYDTIGGIIAGPFESAAQCYEALEALKPLYNRPLMLVFGHLASSHPCTIPKV
jgi:hypothetical protein